MEEKVDIPNQIFRIRGQQVMRDEDLAALYQVRTKRLNEQVRRNLSRFPVDFMFELSKLESDSLRSQIATSKPGRGGRRYRTLVFTEQGVAMLSTVLNSEHAIQVNIAIMRAFVQLRRALTSSRDITARVEKLEGRVSLHDTDIRFLKTDLRKIQSPPRNPFPHVKGFVGGRTAGNPDDGGPEHPGT